MLKGNLFLLIVVQVTRRQKQSLQTLFGPKMHLLGIEETREVGRSRKFFTKSKERGNRTWKPLEMKGKTKDWKKTP